MSKKMYCSVCRCEQDVRVNAIVTATEANVVLQKEYYCENCNNVVAVICESQSEKKVAESTSDKE